MRWLCMSVVLVAGSAVAAEFRSGERVAVEKGEVLEDDLYAFAQTVRIDGEVRGDVVAMGAEVQVPGRVQGDLISAARKAHVEGRVDGSIRAASGDLSLFGVVGKDAVIAGGDVELGPQASVAGDVAVASGAVKLLGSVGGDVGIASGRIVLDGRVGGAVRARTESFTIGDRAAVEGPLQYSASQDARISERASLGSVERLPSDQGRRDPSWFFLGWLRLSIGLFVLGLLWRVVAPKLSREAPAMLRAKPLKSLGIGTLAVLVAPVLGVLLFGMGLLLGGWWLALLLGATLLIAVSLAFPTVGLFVGELLVSRLGRARARLAVSLAIGVLLLALLVRVPVVGALAALAAVLFGLGALLLAGWHLRRVPLSTPAPG
jgi:cytoskeletal protein CcmA (bactofilin family)